MRLIDVDKIYPDVMMGVKLAISQGQLAYAPTVEAIPKDQYEARLKADRMAMLTDIQFEIQEFSGCSCSCSDGIIDDIDDVIQQKIDALK